MQTAAYQQGKPSNPTAAATMAPVPLHRTPVTGRQVCRHILSAPTVPSSILAPPPLAPSAVAHRRRPRSVGVRDSAGAPRHHRCAHTSPSAIRPRSDDHTRPAVPLVPAIRYHSTHSSSSRSLRVTTRALTPTRLASAVFAHAERPFRLATRRGKADPRAVQGDL